MNTPIVLFIFKRKNSLLKIIERIRTVKPSKIYLVSDQGRNVNEIELVKDVRNAVEKAIDWDCTIIKDYAKSNRGVYKNIGLGALRVFENEERAIFLEDDNLPEVSFFQYCEEMLDLYQDNNKVLWICGTNYYKSITTPSKNDNYYFTKHLLPCGWASWKNKFERFYDKDLILLESKESMRRFKESYSSRSLYKQQLRDIIDEKNRRASGKMYSSWDYHMLLSIRAQNLFGIMPANNQITNIGDDDYSTHGGKSMRNAMISRFCQVGSQEFSFPIEKKECIIDKTVEKMIGKKILYPITLRIHIRINRCIKQVFGIPYDKSLKKLLHLR